MGVVTAIDITHDPAMGLDSEQLAEALRRAKDPRIKYIISNPKICSGDGDAWQWRPYPVPPNKNPHAHHVHISVKSDKVHYDSTATWPLDGVAAPASGHVAEIKRPTLRLGATGDAVKELQKLLGLAPDGNFSAATVAAVKKKQESANIVADGIVGPQTWAIL